METLAGKYLSSQAYVRCYLALTWPLKATSVVETLKGSKGSKMLAEETLETFLIVCWSNSQLQN